MHQACEKQKAQTGEKKLPTITDLSDPFAASNPQHAYNGKRGCGGQAMQKIGHKKAPRHY